MADLPPWHHERPWSQLELDDIRRNWAEHPERFSYAAGRWLATLAALPVATAGPDLRAALAAGLADALTKDWPSDTRRSTAPAIADYLLKRPEVAAALRGAAAQADAAQADGGEAPECHPGCDICKTLNDAASYHEQEHRVAQVDNP